MRSSSLVFLILIILISGCSGNNSTKERSIPMMLYEFNEPFRFYQRKYLSKARNLLNLRMGNKHITKRKKPANQFGGKVKTDFWLDLFIISTEIVIS